MPYNILLLPLLGGFIFVRYWNRTKYHAIRADKERILLLASTAGVISLGIAFLVKAIVGWLLPCRSFPSLPCFPNVWYRHIPFEYSAVSVLAFLFGALLWIPLNKGIITWVKSLNKSESWKPLRSWVRSSFRIGWDEKKEIDRVIEEDGDALDKLLRLAEKESKTISATLKSGKIYVGFVSSTSPPTSLTRSVGIVPTKSGYRDPVTKQVHYFIYYSDALVRLNQDIDTRIAEVRGVRRARRRLRNDIRRRSRSLKTIKDHATKDGLRQEIAMLDDRIRELITREEELTTQINNLFSIMDDFRLVFPVTEISTISIYREEVNIEYFAHDAGIEPLADGPPSAESKAPAAQVLPKK